MAIQLNDSARGECIAKGLSLLAKAPFRVCGRTAGRITDDVGVSAAGRSLIRVGLKVCAVLHRPLALQSRPSFLFSATFIYCFPKAAVSKSSRLPELYSSLPPIYRTVNMDAAGDHTSIVNVEIQIIQNLVISRYFSAAGLTLLFYDTVLTMEAEVSRFPAQPRYAHSL